MIHFQVPFAFLTALNQSGYLTQIKCLIQNLHPPHLDLSSTHITLPSTFQIRVPLDPSNKTKQVLSCCVNPFHTTESLSIPNKNIKKPLVFKCFHEV